MIQDIFPHVLFNQYDPEARPQGEDTVLCFRNQELLLSPEGGLPRVRELGEGAYTYLFALDRERFFLAPAPQTLPADFAFRDVKQLRREQALSLIHI